MAQQQTLDLGPIPERDWGEKLMACRDERVVPEVAADVNKFVPCSTHDIYNLERNPTGPMHRTTRARATALCVYYGVNPAELGLSITGDLPETVNVFALRDLGKRRSPWITARPPKARRHDRATAAA